MLIQLQKCIEEKNVVVKKTTLGSISVLFKKKPLVISDDNNVNLTALGYTKSDLYSSNIEQLIKKGVLVLESR
jgi:hypothetical protein